MLVNRVASETTYRNRSYFCTLHFLCKHESRPLAEVRAAVPKESEQAQCSATQSIPRPDDDRGFFLASEDRGEGSRFIPRLRFFFLFFLFNVQIHSRTLIPFFFSFY